MSQFFQIHPDNPQVRLIKQACEIIRRGGLIVYPTDSGYALGCQIGDNDAMERLRRIRQLDADHNFTLVCRDLSELSTYAKFNNAVFRLLKAYTPGPYTFVLPATKEVPRKLQHPKRKTIGLRIPEHTIALALLEELNEPLMSSTLILPGDEMPMTDADDIVDAIGKHVDLIIDGGACGAEPTTVVEFVDDLPEVTRHGMGDTTPFES
ncbi:L-threonylcarbamoyladenylate synthase [Methylophaga sulfidovorans]|uniref:tRNA threonylcarbamoyl adenosine modification protein, Sua5/YciO/YrdC/YwlC family n=1 Tax=Methylophaga sulfidovorans TaxID=45496 RepID=A0A1I3WX05_9GAMM|nr:L-threonylcarbamoyladenylate synthase [Methylophaga sulfidovorans]SFK11903.1 tRNA threonylcarbamoyl adenosine modification protein, Sua5/YciO/YrdC/YwlC family [Methylophaga sulfidovorans]